MNVRKSDVFVADVERQFEWYVLNAGWDIADRYLDAVEATCRFLAQYPQLGPSTAFTHPTLRKWRFFVVFRPFKKHVLFYQLDNKEITMRRAMHGHRDIPRRLLENP
ncbi:MAG TPA: type II toxin-antitoxin system RelE/ParE family toxin [Verrucomicrobiae bacterium]|jgi:plasmid stabilization system protein ParE|nr:type II toxin-antitoxin system RelE/ParE family toxin [Verrucomicrobiae bacterium]